MNELVSEQVKVPLECISIENWLSPPFNRLAFRNVRDFLPVANIACDPSHAISHPEKIINVDDLSFTDRSGKIWTIEQFAEATYADGILIMLNGSVVYESYTPGQTSADEHLMFSVTKSVVGSLVGILVEQGLLNPDAQVLDYIPELNGSAYSQASVRNLLDMTVGVSFEEAYLLPDSAFGRYRQATGWHANNENNSVGMHRFLCEMEGQSGVNGARFHYMSPNTDLLGWVCERVTGKTLATLLSELLWQPIGAEKDAYITVDPLGAPRAAGGLGCTLRDMARFGECMRNLGRAGGRQVIPESWVRDILSSGDAEQWRKGEMYSWMPGGSYRSQWWMTNNASGDYFAAGIYSQWMYISPVNSVVI